MLVGSFNAWTRWIEDSDETESYLTLMFGKLFILTKLNIINVIKVLLDLLRYHFRYCPV